LLILTTFDNKLARVMGPTPPGTEVTLELFEATFSKST